MQELKVTYFLRIVKASLINHFSMWVSSNILFPSISSRQKIGSCITEYIMGNDELIDDNFVSVAHDRIIDLEK